jgi:integrase/recombinase XerD
MAHTIEPHRITQLDPGLTLSELPDLLRWANSFLVAKRAEGLALRTCSFYKEKLVTFTTYCEHRNINTVEVITPDLLREFFLHLEEAGHNPGGVHAYFRTVKVFLKWYERENEPLGWRNPITKVKAPKVPDEPLEPVEMADVDAMLQTCREGRMEDRDRAILLTLLDTGARATELCNIDLADLDPMTGSLLIRQGKGRKPRTVFAGQRTRRALRAYLRHRGGALGPLFLSRVGERLDYDGLRDIIQRRARDAGITPPPLHAFRRAFALAMLRNGADLLTLQRLMGHADLSLLQRYAKQTVDDLRAVHGQASPVDRLLR